MFKVCILTIISCLLFLGASSNNFDSWLGKPAPDFTLETVSGQATLSLKDYRGKVVLVDFWASWCAPCKKSLPELQKIDQEYEDLRILAINIDDQKKNALKFMKKINLDMTVLFDEEKEVAEIFNLSEMPSAVLIDQEGVVRQVFPGYTKNKLGEFKQAIEKYLISEIAE